MKNLLKKYTKLELMFLLMTIPATMAFFQGDTTLNDHLAATNAFRVAMTYLLVFLSMFILIRRKVGHSQIRLMAVILVWWIMTAFHVASGISPQWNLLTLGILLVYTYFRPDERMKIFELYRMYIVVMCACGILTYLFYILNVPFPCKVVSYYTGDEVQRHIFVWGYYYNYHIGYLHVVGPLVRLCGWFNEPGYLGTIGSLVLVAQGINLKRKGNIVILVAMLFTFSLAALVILGGYLITMMFKKKGMIIGVCCFVIAAAVFIPSIFKNNATYQMFSERLQIEDGEFKGDNRANNSIFQRLQEKQFYNTQDTLFGLGNGALDKQGRLGISGIKVQLYLYGVIGVILTYGMLFFIAWKLTKGNYQARCFVFWYFASTYQRSYIFAPDYMLILFGGLAYIATLNSEKSNRKIPKVKPVTPEGRKLPVRVDI